MFLAMPPPILIYDGVCGLCNRLVQFILRRDRHAVFRFASLQSPPAIRILTRHGVNPSDLDTVYVIVNHDLAQDAPNDSPQGAPSNEYLLARSDAVLFILNQFGGFCRVLAFFLRLSPKFLRDRAYNAVARRRYRIFGRSETCALPSPQDRSRFLDLHQ